MTDTATAILDSAQELIQTRGFTAMSFQDIATQVGIKKPSIIHHFPNKAALGVAVIRRYRDTFATLLEGVKADPAKTVWDALDFYFSPYLAFAESPTTVCLCGALTGEIMAIPAEMNAEVKDFIECHQKWLEAVLRQGRKEGQFHFKDTPKRLARLCFSSLQGALLVKRATGDISQVKDVTKVIRQLLR